MKGRHNAVRDGNMSSIQKYIINAIFVRKLMFWYDAVRSELWSDTESFQRKKRTADIIICTHGFLENVIRRTNLLILELDKDLLGMGRKIYSPDTCLFIPRKINSLLSAGYHKVSEELPAGVRKVESGYSPLIGKGIYATIEEAYHVNIERIQLKLQTYAEAYYGQIPPKVYDALMNWNPIEK